MQQLPLPIAAEPAPSFDNFLVGANAAALAQLESLRSGAAPIYLWGPAGCGKTHLLHAAADRWQRSGGRAAWFDSARALPWSIDDGISLVVLDGCDAFDPTAQHAAFALFIEAAERAAVLIAAGRVPPVDLPLRDDLKSRLAWGHVHAIVPLADAEARAALRREADRRGIFLGDEVMDYLLNRFERDLGSLMRLLDRLDRYSLANKRGLSVPLVRQMCAQVHADAQGEQDDGGK